MSATKFVIVILTLAVMTTGCSTTAITMNAPDGFAQYKDSQGLRAISSDSVVYQIRELKNKPYADLEFWKKALKKQMIDSGYHFISESSFKGEAGLGYLIELAAPIHSEDYTYLMAIYVDKKRVVVIESTGEISKVKPYRESIISAMKKVSF